MAATRQRRKRVPQRSCVSCGAQGAKRELLRVVRTPEGGVVYDSTQKAAGRGAYVCRSRSCLEKAVRSGALSRSLRTPVDEETMRAVADALDE